MKRIPRVLFFIVAILILLFSVTSIFGVSYYVGDIEKTVIKGIDDIRWGTDISGGVEATFEPAKDYDATEDQLEAAKAIIEVRMVSSGITDYELYADYNSDHIIVRFPWKEDEASFDVEAAIEEISSTALLSFRPGTTTDPSTGAPSGDTATILMEGSMVKKAKADVYTDQSGVTQHCVSLTLTDKGADKFAEITKTYQGQVVSIWMDDTMISAPTINDVITTGEAMISGDFDAKSAKDLADKINGGALPFQLSTVSYGSISATLGENSLMAMAMAGVIAFVIISLLMIVMYRLPGFITVIALLGQMGITVAIITKFFPVFDSFTMTLPGIAGLILSIGMGVDANVITAERIKEEMRMGRTLDGALDRGSKSALSAIIDGNMTIVIVSIILLLVFGPTNVLSWLFGQSTTGTIYSFGYTLLMGVISNFIMGVALSRVMLRSVAGYKWARHKWLFGGVRDEK